MPEVDITHWDEVTEKQIESHYKPSSKGDEYLFCPMCTIHVEKEYVLDNRGSCPGCEQMEEAQQGRRGAL